MDIVYRPTVLTEADTHSITLSWVLTLTWEDDALSCDRHLMDESLLTESIDDTVECREIHTAVSLSDECSSQIRKSHSRRLLELFDEASTRHSDTRSRHRVGSYEVSVIRFCHSCRRLREYRLLQESRVPMAWIRIQESENMRKLR